MEKLLRAQLVSPAQSEPWPRNRVSLRTRPPSRNQSRAGDVCRPAEPQVSATSVREAGDGAGADAGAPIPPDAVDPELIRLQCRRRAVIPAWLSLCWWSACSSSIGYAPTCAMPPQPAEPQAIGCRHSGGGWGKPTPTAIDGFVSLTGVPDHRNASRSIPGRATRQHVFRLLGTRSRVFVTAPATIPPPLPRRIQRAPAPLR